MAQQIAGTLYGRCGRACSRCGFYRAKTKEQRHAAHDTWWKYFFKPQNPDWAYCHGCGDALNPPTSHHHAPIGPMDLCYVRRCAIQYGVQTCAHCSKFPCKHLAAVAKGVDREKYEAQSGSPIPEQDYLQFFEPFEGLRHLNELRKHLATDEIRQVAPPPSKTEMAPFPDRTTLPVGREEAYRALHLLLSTLFAERSSSFAEQGLVEKRRRVIYSVLWLFASKGSCAGSDRPHIEMDGLEFQRERKKRNLNTWVQYFGLCAECRKCGECDFVKASGLSIEALAADETKHRAFDGRTPFVLRMSVAPKAGNEGVLRLLMEYAKRLSTEYGKNAVKHFARADMSFAASG